MIDMRSTKQSKCFKTRVVSIAVCAVFILCAVLSIGLTLWDKNIFAADGEESTPVAKTVDGIRFVQVAAGEDFAIGLTFDGDLYGWSLNEDSVGGEKGNELGVTLGDYYSSTPTKINVKFRQGPGSGGTYNWSNEGSVEYHTEIKEDKIKKIVATRTTAAFITENGYIYTWGKDVYSPDEKSIETAENVFMSDLNDVKHYLLLRATSGETTQEITWFDPYIIDYGYYSKGAALDSMTYIAPTSNDGLTNTDIAAGEYNYIFLYTKSGGTYTYVWGSLMYSTVQTGIKTNYDYLSRDTGHVDLLGGVNNRVRAGVNSNELGNAVAVVAGGYNVGINRASAPASGNATSLQLRGRNVLTSQYNNGYVNSVSVVSQADSSAGIVYSQGSSSDLKVTGGIIGGSGKGTINNQLISGEEFKIDNYYGRLSSGSGALAFSQNTSMSIKNSRGQTLDKVDENDLYRSVIRYGVSLGNDVGYGIASGRLYGWGDNAQGQLGKAAGGSSQTPTGILASESSSFVAVAAGKQLSADDKAFYSRATLSMTGSTVNGFSADVQNEAEFISGAVTSDGKLYVWSNGDPEPKPVTYGDVTGTVNDTDKFIAVYSGYGNNLFAITSIGKLIRLEYKDGAYKQTRYDSFASVGGQPIANWAVDSTNTVAFAPSVEPTVSQPAPDLGSATFYVWKSTNESRLPENEETSSLGTVRYNVTGGTAGEYIPLVSSNAIGDVYRILGINGDNGKAGHFLSPLDEDLSAVTSFAPVYSYGTDAQHLTVMTPKQRENMFAVQFVTDENGVGIKIKPKQSSKGYIVTVDFYVARYNAESNFKVASGSVTDTALYYDLKPCRITFTVADTPTVKNYSAYDANNNNKSNVPLLDPNNEYNKNYSIAVQNVSGGVDALLAHLNASGVKSNVLEKMTQADAGFPASSKIVSGDLTYYLGADAAKKYNDVYQYLFSDRDSDRVVATALEDGMMEGIDSPTSAVKGKMQTVTVDDIDTGVVLSGKTIEEVRAALATDFDNVYGLYNIVLTVNEENDHILLGFSYDVMTFTAEASTGNIRYTSKDVTSYQTTSSNPRVNASLQAVTRPAGYNVGFETIGSGIAVPETRNIASVFAAATLRMNKTHPDGSVITGKSEDGNNKYTEVFAKPIVVGESVSVNIADYFTSRSDRIVFSYQNEATTEKYNQFNNLFVDETGNGIKPVVLQGTTLTVTPSTDIPINLTVTVQRFASTDDYTAYFDGGNEKIEMTFIFDQIRDFTFTASATAESTFLITKTQTIDALARNNSLNTQRFVAIGGNGIDSQIDNLYNQVKISNILSSEDRKSQRDKLFSVAAVSGTRTAFAITPYRSGSGVVTFTATLYNKSLTFSISVNVSAVTYVADSITIDNDKYIYVDAVKSELEKSNKFNDDIDDYRILYNDISNPEASSKLEYHYNAIYFTDESGEVASPTFIKNVVFEGVESSKPNIRIVSGDSVTNDAAKYYMHVKFVLGDAQTYAEAPDGSIIEAIYTVESGKVRIPVTVNIDCRDNQNSSADGLTLGITGSGMDTSVSVSVEQLLNRVGIEGASQYSVVIIQPDSAVADYFDYTADSNGKNIILTPKANTPTTEGGQVPMVVQVSVSNGSDYKMLTFEVTVSGILTTLPVMQENGIIGYGNIWLYSFVIVFGVLAIIFIVRLIVYWKKRAKQRAIIKRNQELIRMRDRMHNKATAATREQVVRTKLKMDDPKYAKMFNEMRKSKEEESGVILEHSDLAATSDAKSKKKKKKKGGKKTVAELKAELEAKKAAFAAAQAQNAQPVNPFVQDVSMDDGAYAAPDADFVSQDGGFGSPDGGFDAGVDDFGAQSVDGSEIIFDASDIGDGM